MGVTQKFGVFPLATAELLTDAVARAYWFRALAHYMEEYAAEHGYTPFLPLQIHVNKTEPGSHLERAQMLSVTVTQRCVRVVPIPESEWVTLWWEY